MSAAVSRRLDDEGLPLPPPVHGRVSGVLLRVQVTVTRAVNSALFIVVILELLRTIVARLEGGGSSSSRSWSSASSRPPGTFSPSARRCP